MASSDHRIQILETTNNKTSKCIDFKVKINFHSWLISCSKQLELAEINFKLRITYRGNKPVLLGPDWLQRRI